MTVNQLRWTILIISFFFLSFGGLAAISVGNFLPAYSCFYVDSRSGTCFLWVMQHLMDHGFWGAYQSLAKYLLYFSVLAVILGRAWCGWVCPLGLLQDLLDLMRRKLGYGYISFSPRLRSNLASIKWIFFFIALLIPLWVAFPLVLPTVAGDLHQPFCQLCPGKYILPLMVGDLSEFAVNFKSPTTIVMSLMGLVLAVVVVMGAMAKRRFWCPYCPLGLLVSWYRKIGFFKLKKDIPKCTACEVCYNACPVEISDVYLEREKKNVTFADCTLCLQCVAHCPEDNALQATFLGKTIYRSSSKGFFSRRYGLFKK